MSAVATTLGNLGMESLIAGVATLYYRRRVFPLTLKFLTFWPRVWALVVDMVVLWPVTGVILLLDLFTPPAVLAVSLTLLLYAVSFTYHIWMLARWGQTVGKMACKVRVVDGLTGGAIMLRQAVIRVAVPWVLQLGFIAYDLDRRAHGVSIRMASREHDMAMTMHVFLLLAVPAFVWTLAEVITMFSNPKRRTIHDFIAGTAVVRTHLIDEPTPAVAA